MKTTLFIASMGLLAIFAQAETGKPEDIPESGRIRIDGRLEDWKRVEWAPLEQTLDGNPVNVSNARWALQWDEDGMLYIAVQYDDADIVLQDSVVNSNAQDCVEIFVRGDTGSQPGDYSKTQSGAQHYIFGLAKDKTTAWKKLAGIDPFPLHNPAKVAVALSGKTFTYEIMVPLYDEFSAASRWDSEITETYVDVEIGADIAIMDAGSKGYAGRKSENTLPEKPTNADHIAEHTLSE
jgi:hypothetical protein